MLALIVRLGYLQIYRGEELALRAVAQRMRPQTIDAQGAGFLIAIIKHWP